MLQPYTYKLVNWDTVISSHDMNIDTEIKYFNFTM